jgi:hypothetical protein
MTFNGFNGRQFQSIKRRRRSSRQHPFQGGIDGGAQRLESHLNGAWGGRPAVRTDGGSGSVSVEGRRKGEGAGGLTWAKRLSKAGQFQGKRVQATRRMQDEM